MRTRGRARARVAMAPTATMTSMPVTLDTNPTAANRHIPLLCSVCPETPKFSDVSHLLTHIASKGHLHHETQTKLRAHQDITAALSLQQYEQWYRDFEIETLLVERLRAKQVKEAARGRRAPPHTSSLGVGRDKKRLSGPSLEDLIKVEEEYFPDFSNLPNLLSTDLDPDVIVEHVTGPDMMTLKGQVWPGMGKMDLANDEMRRTRNQRKPKSVIERMRRASQGIEPTEVVMSTDLEVERTRGVYDKTSSPELDDIDPPSEKKPKQKRKRPAPLAEISANVPRGFSRSTTAKVSKSVQRAKQSRASDHDSSPHHPGPFQPYKQNHQVFSDGSDSFLSATWPNEPSIRSAHTLGSFPYPTYSTVSHADQRFNFRERYPVHSLNPFSLSNRGSPTSITKQGGGRTQGSNTHRRPTRTPNATTEEYPTGTLSNVSAPFSPPALPRFQPSSRLAMLSNQHMYSQSQTPYEHQIDDQHRLKQEDFSLSESPFRNSASQPFMGLTGQNPLFAQDHGFADMGQRNLPHASASTLGFLSVNRERSRTRMDSYDRGTPALERSNVKLEHNALGTNDTCLDGRGPFLGQSVWDNTDNHDEGNTSGRGVSADDLGL
ncbi:hypothetical protein NLU13_2959 [Sarocladium strictum]|uniref:Uncharacterized protein n=1 Tax=Sarocladium strictum TaxID=5046 RepID=A0AA39GLY4_SARSR|nr:hypothetical protein NLU13_2959 [Sarocladium strictum]